MKPKIVVYDRYRKQFFDAGFHTCRWRVRSRRAEDYQTMQMDIEGYDPDHYLTWRDDGSDDLNNLHAAILRRAFKQVTS
jgi:hypothetical protein